MRALFQNSCHFQTLLAMSTAAVDSYTCDPAPLWMRLISIAIAVVCVGVGSISSLTTLLAFVKSRHILWKFSNINIFCLTVNDLINNAYVSSLFAEMYWNGCWLHSIHHCRLFVLADCYTYHASLALIALIAYDRHLMVKLGASYQHTESAGRVLLRTIPFGILWPALLGISAGWYNVVSGVTLNVAGTCLVELMQNWIGYQLMIWLGLVLPLSVMVACYVSVYSRFRHKVLNSSNTVLPMTITVHNERAVTKTRAATNISKTEAETVGGGEQRQLRKLKRTAKTLNALFGVVLLTSAPYVALTIVVSVILAGNAPWLDAVWWTQIFLLTQQFAWVNNAVNPLLYAHTMPEFRQAMTDVWQPVINVSKRVVTRLRAAWSEPQGTDSTWANIVNPTIADVVPRGQVKAVFVKRMDNAKSLR